MHELIAINNSNKAKHFLSPYTTVINVNGYLFEIKRGSYSVLGSIRVYGDHDVGELRDALEIGQFVERNHSTIIVVGGEHLTSNKYLINTFQSAEIIKLSVTKRENFNSRMTAKTVIGDHVVLSSNTTILNGTVIGHNSLLAAGAVTNNFHQGNSILAGVPARKIGEIKSLKSEWWNYSFDGIIDFFDSGEADQPLDECKDIKINFSASLSPQNTVVNLKFSHIEIKGERIGAADLSSRHIDYLNGAEDKNGRFLVSDHVFLDLLNND